MPPQTQRWRTDNASEDEEESRNRQPRRPQDSNSEEEDVQDENGDVDMTKAGDEAQMIKKLVRYVLACEYARLPIRRDGIREKVLGNNARSFKRVFDGAQLQLRQVFGMEMAELPVREKRTLKEKQKANATQRKAGGTTSSKTYILVSILPSVYKTPAIKAPSRVPSSTEEAEYIGFYTFVIALICLNGGELSKIKLEDYLDRMNAKKNLPFDTTDNVLAKLVKQGYIDRVVEKTDGEDDTINWHVGTRGKVEVPRETVAAFIKQIWHRDIPKDLNKRINRSLGLKGASELPEDEFVDEEEEDES